MLDPFCGSGTLLVEAGLLGRHAVGCDVDPVAVFASRVKTRPLTEKALVPNLNRLLTAFSAFERDKETYARFTFDDLSSDSYAREAEGLSIPAIPNLFHWFRRYVVIDLARMRVAIRSLEAPATHRAFFELCFASIIRAASNADPVPVSGLEVTSYMKQRDKDGRIVNPFALFSQAARRAIRDMNSYSQKVDAGTRVSVLPRDATKIGPFRQRIDGVITSPPYH